jgi:hypothetical protein
MNKAFLNTAIAASPVALTCIRPNRLECELHIIYCPGCLKAYVILLQCQRPFGSSLPIDSKCSQAVVSAERFVLIPQKLRAETVVRHTAEVKAPQNQCLATTLDKAAALTKSRRRLAHQGRQPVTAD